MDFDNGLELLISFKWWEGVWEGRRRNKIKKIRERFTESTNYTNFFSNWLFKGARGNIWNMFSWLVLSVSYAVLRSRWYKYFHHLFWGKHKCKVWLHYINSLFSINSSNINHVYILEFSHIKLYQCSYGHNIGFSIFLQLSSSKTFFQKKSEKSFYLTSYSLTVVN